MKPFIVVLVIGRVGLVGDAPPASEADGSAPATARRKSPLGDLAQRPQRVVVVALDLLADDVAVELVEGDRQRQVGEQRRRRGERQRVAAGEIAVDQRVGVGQRPVDDVGVDRARSACPRGR